MSIIVLGTAALDTVKTPYGSRKDMLGGSAVHFAMAARLFTRVHLATIIGRDFPKQYLNFLKKKNIVLTSLIENPGRTFRWRGEYRGDLNAASTLNTELGVLSAFRPIIAQEAKKIKYLFLANVDPQAQEYLLQKIHFTSLVGLDSMNYWIHHKRKEILKLLRKVNIYVASEQEARDLSGESNLIQAARYLRSCGPKIVLIKKGEHGVIFYSDKFIFCLPAYPTAEVVDPTGAGDTFAGGFMGYLAKTGKINESNLRRAAIYGTIAASFNVEGFGLECSSVITLRDLEERSRKFKKMILF